MRFAMSSRRVLLPLFGVVVLLLAMVATLWWHRSQAADEPRGNAIVEALSGEEVGGYARALTPGALQFPRDLGAHPDYRTEWWYYTGNLETQEGREFGFQLTFFRTALAPPGRSATGTSAFRTSQIYFAHFAVSDVERERFFQDEQFARGAAGLAGAEAVPYHVWVNDWAAQELKDGRVALQAQSEEAEIMLYLTPTLPPVLHGDEGLSRKGARPGNASYYYSIVRQEVRGEVGV
ncbi:MAG: carotenoid 1,2-hydratase, partial [Caldilineae bacterium]